MNAVQGQVFKECLTDISFVGTKLSFDVLQEVPLSEWFPVIHVCWSEHEVQDFSLIIDYQMEFESEEPFHGALPAGSQPFKSLVYEYLLVTAYTGRDGIHETDAGACAQ